MKTLVVSILFVTLSGVVGCSSTGGQFRRTSELRPLKPVKNVDFYMAGFPKKTHREIGYITAQGNSYRDAFDRVQRIAVDNQCEAVANLHESVDGAGATAVTRMSASCYVYRK